MTESIAELAGIREMFTWLRTAEGRAWLVSQPGTQLAFPWGEPKARPGTLGL
jgi:hypothetical protein